MSARVSDTRAARALSVAIDALFAIVSVALLGTLLLPVPLYVPPGCTDCLLNVARLPVVPFIAALLLAVTTDREVGLRRRLVRGLALGLGAAAYAALLDAAVIPFHDAYFTTLYRAYALGYVALATAVAALAAFTLARRAGAVATRRFARRLVLVGVIAIAAAVVRGELLVAAAALAGAGAGALASRAERARVALSTRVGPSQAALGLALVAFALRVLFGLQTLARTGPGHAFSVASDDGESYYANAVAMVGDFGYAEAVLRAADGFPPLYSFFLWAIFTVTNESMATVIVVQAAFAGAASVLVYLIGRRYGSPWVGVLAAFLFAMDQNLIQNQSTLTTEAVFVPMLLLGLWALVRYCSDRRWRWFALAAITFSLVFITRNLVALVAAAAAIWLFWLSPRRPRRAALQAALLVAAIVIAASPVAIATGRTETRPRFTNQLADTGWEYVDRTPYVVENGFLIERGIRPFSDPGGSVAAVARDPLPVIGFFAGAVPQRLRYLLFSVEPGSSDPLTITNPATFPNRYAQLVDVVLVLAAIVAVVTAIRRRAWRTHPELALFALFVLLYLALFAFVFPPRQAFRYRIPIVPLLMIAESVGLWLLARVAARAWSPVR